MRIQKPLPMKPLLPLLLILILLYSCEPSEVQELAIPVAKFNPKTDLNSILQTLPENDTLQIDVYESNCMFYRENKLFLFKQNGELYSKGLASGTSLYWEPDETKEIPLQKVPFVITDSLYFENWLQKLRTYKTSFDEYPIARIIYKGDTTPMYTNDVYKSIFEYDYMISNLYHTPEYNFLIPPPPPPSFMYDDIEEV